MKKPISLIGDIIDKEDIKALSEWVATNPRLSKGPLTLEFEKKWAKWLGTKHAVFVNSGSSANLLMIYALICHGWLKKGDKVIVPALSWATDVAPLIQLGLTPILCDCNLKDLSIDVNHLKQLIEKHPDAKTLLLVHVLGLVPDMSKIMGICEKENILLLEDCCESMGSQFWDKNVGTFGKMSTFSMFFSHHISTIEGGMICTDDDKLYNILISIRAHGWGREWNKIPSYWDDYDRGEFYNQFTFYYPGFNVRSTDLQAFIGLRQLNKINSIFAQRKLLFEIYDFYLNHKCKFKSNGYTSLFATPVLMSTFEKAQKLVEKLKEENIECRPIISGSMSRQPFYVERYGYECMPNAEIIDERGLFLPCHYDISEEDMIRMCNIVNSIEEE